MSSKASADLFDFPFLIDDRYQVLKTLGRGGTSVVYAVRDTVTEKNLALKQLQSQKHRDKQKYIEELFEYEYYTLAQLSHPRVVEVFDFGISQEIPYYTMELLEGGDLRQLSPLDWKTVCSLLCDVCSVLSLLHSRGLIHRDITPRNVRCTRDSKAKLIDFGSMVPMGVGRKIVCTPAYTAPEVIALQSLDARADLYSLGATLYYSLTGCKAYPAKSFRDLQNVWRCRPPPPSQFVEDIPKELDQLVLSLLELDPMARPESAAEVIDRLSAIASFKVNEQLMVSQSYLLKPVLVGRATEISLIRKRIVRMLRGSGTAVMVEGVSGAGRSRFLDACVLEGKLAGATVLRVDANDAQKGDWGAVGAIASQLIHNLPEVAIEAAEPFYAVLGPFLSNSLVNHSIADSSSPLPCCFDEPWGQPWESANPENRPALSEAVKEVLPSEGDSHEVTSISSADKKLSQPGNKFKENRSRLQSALCDWLFKISRQRSLLVAVDDLHCIDEPSAAFFAITANQISDKMMMVIATRDIDIPLTTTDSLLRSASHQIELGNLRLEDTENLLRSIFADVPHIQILSNRLYGNSKGNPAMIIQLAQHLVDRKLVRYQAGAWTIPREIDTNDMPSSLADTLKAQIYNLSHPALVFAQTIALSPKQNFSFEECLDLMESKDKAQRVGVLNELTTLGIMTTDGCSYALSQSGWTTVLLDNLEPTRQKTLHLRLAEVFLRRGNQSCRAAKHLFATGHEESGLDVLIKDIEDDKQKILLDSQAFTEYILSLPNDWIDIFERAISICKRLGRPLKQSYELQVALTRFFLFHGVQNLHPINEVVKQLIHDSGLGIYRELDHPQDPESRLKRALEIAQNRFDSSPESVRVQPPAKAISELVGTVSRVCGISGRSHDYELIEAMPSLEPFFPLSPAFAIVDNSTKTVKYLNSGHLERALHLLQVNYQRLVQADRAGFDDTIYEFAILALQYTVGLLETSFGINSAVKWADSIEHHPLYQVNAWRIRLVNHLRQGDIEKAEECKRQIELLQIQNSPIQYIEGSHHYAELLVYVLVDDLVRVKRILESVATMAEQFTTWIPTLHYARGEFQRIRGDYTRALVELTRVFNLIIPGRHPIWPYAVGAYIKVLYHLERFEEAKVFGEENLKLAEELELDYMTKYIQLPLALVQAKAGDVESALRTSQSVIDKNLMLGATGINLGLAYETRAYIAIWMGDEENFYEYSKLCAEQYSMGKYTALVVRYEKLLQTARQLDLSVSDHLARTVDWHSDSRQKKTINLISHVLKRCKSKKERTHRILEFLISESNSLGGYLYTIQNSSPTLCAQYGNRPPPSDLNTVARDYILAEINDYSDVMVTVADLGNQSQSLLTLPNGEDKKYRHILLSHSENNYYTITGLAILYIDQDERFSLSDEMVTVLSKHLLEAGDVINIRVDDFDR